MTRKEHVEWCKQRAREYADRGELADAVASMLSDMSKHPETHNPANTILAMLGMQAAMSGDQREVVRFIDGFN